MIIRIEQYYSDVAHHNLPFVNATLCVPPNPLEAYIEETTLWAGFVKTPFQIELLNWDNRGEPYRCFATAESKNRIFPLSLRDAASLISAMSSIPVSDSLYNLLIRRGYLPIT